MFGCTLYTVFFVRMPASLYFWQVKPLLMAEEKEELNILYSQYNQADYIKSILLTVHLLLLTDLELGQICSE